MRPNTFCLTTSRQSTLWTTQFPVTPGAQVELGWWTSALNLSVGMVFPLPLPTCTVTTDASHRGWGGGHLEEAQALGQWSLLESEAHVNLLDRLAVLGTLQAFAQRLTGRRVRIQTDNSTVVAYLNSQGGTHSRVLCRHTGTLLQWCFDRSNVSDCSPYRS